LGDIYATKGAGYCLILTALPTSNNDDYTESGLKLLGLDLASLATQGVGARAQPNASTGYGLSF